MISLPSSTSLITSIKTLISALQFLTWTWGSAFYLFFHCSLPRTLSLICTSLFCCLPREDFASFCVLYLLFSPNNNHYVRFWSGKTSLYLLSFSFSSPKTHKLGSFGFIRAIFSTVFYYILWSLCYIHFLLFFPNFINSKIDWDINNTCTYL